MRALLISTYELGRQPFGLASPLAWLRREGIDAVGLDLSRDRLERPVAEQADLVAIHLPMHTATRLAGPVIERVREWRPDAHLCAYGLYAPLNQEWLRGLGVQTVLGGEFEADLVALACAVRDRKGSGAAPASPSAPWDRPRSHPRLSFVVPDRRGLPPPARYVALRQGDAPPRATGYTEASRGCKHRCRHCPIVPVYDGQFRIVPVDVVLADIRQQVRAGATHITFGDPDFFNGITHAIAVVESFGREFPGVTYDVTVKVEHLLRHGDSLPRLRDTGCLFITSAAESIDDDVLVRLAKGHTRRDFEQVVAMCRAHGVTLAPTFVPFTPWTTLEGYGALLDALADLDLVGQVAPIQLAIRLLLPSGSALLPLDDLGPVVQPFDPDTLTHPWRHPNPRVDALQQEIERLVGAAAGEPRAVTFDRVRAVARKAAGRPGLPAFAPGLVRPRTAVPYLDEPWYC
jgi:radical SAM superfamily enzyme YgiQ (UPF0313 family)